MSAAKSFDSVTLEILWSRLVAIADEQTAMILRTAFSPIVRESQDFACVVLNARGELLAQPYQTLPAFTRAASVVTTHFMRKWSDWEEGDVAITNDPWLSTGHLHDVSIVIPVFHKGRRVAFCANIAHQADIGGRGYSADANSIFEEGLALPPMKLYRGGKLVPEVLEIVADNVRVPDQVLGDLNSQVIAARLGARRIQELLAEAGLDDLDALSDTILDRSEKAMRAAIARVPDGVYRSQGSLDGYDSPLQIHVALTVRGDELSYDFAGTAPQIQKGINSCYNYTYGYAAFATKSALEPLVPNNEGAYRPIGLVAPEASIVNSRRPAPGNSRARVGHMVVPIVFGALSKALPDLLPAEAGAPAPRFNFFGSRDDGSEFQCMVITSGGLGAGEGRDGLPGKAFPTNTKMAALEVLESGAPIRFLKRELVPDSGGVGRFRGGLAQEIQVQVVGGRNVHVSTSFERMHYPPVGYQGGGNGAPAMLWKNDREHLPPKARSALRLNDIVTARTPGGGGFGNPDDRDPDLKASDVIRGYVSATD